jgi:hypothetical protein
MGFFSIHVLQCRMLCDPRIGRCKLKELVEKEWHGLGRKTDGQTDRRADREQIYIKTDGNTVSQIDRKRD